jgi:NAD(P)-dependent dehydrogenase (short-subunit alcohol dehydrogenase family)
MAAAQMLEGRVAIVTGGGGEIGSAIARRFAAEGAAVLVADISLDKASTTASAITGAGGKAHPFALDVTKPEQCEHAVAEAASRFGKLTTLANVAATVTPQGTVETLSYDDWRSAFNVNLDGMFWMCKFAVPEMRKAGGGAIVNIASSHGHIGMPRRPAYCSSKAAVLQFTKCLAIDFGADNIRANSISPGAIDTLRAALQRFKSREEANAAKGPAYLVGRTGKTEEIAAGAAFLASEEAAFMTGTDMLIDGGYMAFKGTTSNPV